MKPDGWVKVRDVSSIVTKGTTPTSLGRSFTPNGVRFLKVESFANDGSLVKGREAFIDESTHQLLRRSQLAEGDILFSIAGALGRSTAVEREWLPANTNQALAVIRPTGGRYKLLPRYLLWQLRSPVIARRIAEINVQAAQANLSLEQVRDFEIPLVSVDEQLEVVTALDDVEDLVISLERLIAKKRAIKQGMMQELLTGRTRLPGFSAEWDRRLVKEIVATPVTDGPHLTPVFMNDGIPFLSVNNLVDGKIDWSDLRYISRADHEFFSRKCRPLQGDVLMGKAASVGRVAYLDTEREVNIWSPIALIRPAGAYDARFIHYQLQSAATARQIELLTNTSSQGNIGMGEIEKIELALPSLCEQQAIAHVLLDVDAEIDVFERRLAATRAIKQGVMQELLTGRPRLPVEEAAP